MDFFLALPSDEQRIYCEQSENKVHLPAATIEKDLWVCWTLRTLFQLPDCGPHLTFKGGTALSKGWNLIDRFSEDIDITIDRGVLGFSGADAPDQAPSKTQMRKRMDALVTAAQAWVKDTLQPRLSEAIGNLPAHLSCNLTLDPEDDTRQTLLLAYPTAFPNPARYLRQDVKIELGARSENEPAEQITIRPYLADAFPEEVSNASFTVQALLPKRTFWEKAMLLHEETFRDPSEKQRKARMARHYYDVFKLIQAGVAAEAAIDLNLFKRIAEHRAIYFRHRWVDYSTLVPGHLRLVPPIDQMAGWRSDYEAMTTDMFAAAPPAFDEIIEAVRTFQAECNQAEGT